MVCAVLCGAIANLRVRCILLTLVTTGHVGVPIIKLPPLSTRMKRVVTEIDFVQSNTNEPAFCHRVELRVHDSSCAFVRMCGVGSWGSSVV